MRYFCVIIIFLNFLSCNKETNAIEKTNHKDQALIQFVNPFIGTGGHGHTYPGATMPFGMMQLSPDTRLDGWDGCSGYHYSDDYIYGFSHTHLSGTGVSDYGDILLMPTNQINFNNGEDGKAGYRAHFSHENEIAEPGFYKVHLDSTNIDVELTVSKRSGMHKYTFPSAEKQVVILDLVHRDKVLEAKIDKISNTEIVGYRFSEAWAKDQRLFFAIQTSHPFEDVLQPPKEDGTEDAMRTALTFINPNNDPINIKIGISAVDIVGAKQNLKQEIGTTSFENVKKVAQDTWERQLHKIVVETDQTDDKINFYTALYHSMLAPNLYQDVDGRYRGMDLNIHQTKDFEYYTVFSLWDTYRATHPLFTIIEQDKTNDFINTFLAKYDEGGIMPIWDLAGNYTGCMIGYHAVPVIADAYLKGITNYDAEKAFQAMKHSAMQDKLGLKDYKSIGFIPVENESESVSKTLEYAYDDWTIAKMAESLNKTEDAKLFYHRAQNYKNVFDPETQFMRGRFRNTWFTPFDPYEVNFNYTEANSWQYSFYVPQDISGFIDLLGGKQELEQKLDDLFTAEDKTSGAHQVDITGLIGQYAHGNEPSHHMAYLYNFVNKPYKTQEKVREILITMYKNEPDGISGNEDCGQMSAWYVFSSLGFYPVTPGSNTYIIGSPIIPKATFNLENGNTFTVIAENVSAINKYIASATLNGKTLNRSFITHKSIVEGGTLHFRMTSKPTKWATKNEDIPETSISTTKFPFVPSPFIEKGEIAFKNETEISLNSAEKNNPIYFSINNQSYKKYTQPFKITENTVLKVYAEKHVIKSAVLETSFYKIDQNLSLKLNTTYENRYSGGGPDALIDGVFGTADFKTGTWQGYLDTNLDVVLDLGQKKATNHIKINFLEDQRSWIFLPKKVIFYGSNDAKTFEEVSTHIIGEPENNENVTVYSVKSKKMNKKYRFIKVYAETLGNLPKWHLGFQHNGKSWIFTDEITVD
jgi:predicted alpha-1,2-mannosidase